MTDSLRLAIGTLSRLPVPAPRRIDRQVAGTAMSLAPLIGLVLAVACGLPLLIPHERPLMALLLSAVACALLAWATRALHLDGLADTADALGSGKPAAQALEIARKSDIGPFGVITLILTLLIQIVAVASFPDGGRAYLVFVLAVVTGRIALSFACTRAWPAARPDGLGALVAASVPLGIALIWMILGLGMGAWLLGISGVVSVAIGMVAATVILVIAQRRLGGVTGDVLGATIEIATGAVALSLAVLPSLAF
jgi:adenosylcobinamide-GDP ribazoletransferase